MATNVKILGIAFSPRHGNTEILLREALMAAEELPGVETDYYDIVGKKIEPCDSCYRCFQKATFEKCCPAYEDGADCFEELVQLVYKADALILANPVYYMTITAQLKAFMDRSMGVEALGYPWRNKVAGFLTVAYDRNGGQEHTIRDMQTFTFMHDMIPVSVGPERPANGIGGYTGAMACQGFPYPVSSSKPNGVEAVREDTVGMYAARCVGWRVAEVAKIVKAGFAAVEKGETKWPKGSISLDMVEEWS
jgi:multimeric flavodoxin WrbA